MSLPRLPAHLTRRDAVAVILILPGLAGMVRHFSAKPEPAASASPRATATTFTAPAIPRFSLTPDASRPSEAVQAMRRRLREFVIPLPNIKSLPAPDALALLQHFWQTLPHETDAIPPATFTFSESAAPQLAASQPPILVSLEIPGISLLTHLQLLAAQTELQLRITESGTILELPATRANSKIKTTTIPLDALTIKCFTSRSLHIFRDQADTLDESARRKNFLTDPKGVEISVQLMSKSAPVSFGNTRDILESVANDSYTIDFNMEPEVIEFEGFINYGTTIQTTGINATGASEPITLTESGITQPVFATRMLEDQQKKVLAKLFASMGIPEQRPPTDSKNQTDNNGHFWNSEENTLTTTGPQSTQRIAAATAAAIHEAANAGARLEFATGDWQNNGPPPDPTHDLPKNRKPSGSNGRTHPVSAAQPPSLTYLKTKYGVPMAGLLPPLWSNPDFLLPPPASTARVVVEKTGSRFLLDLTVELPGRPDILFTNAAKPAPDAHFLPRRLVKSNHWHRFDLSTFIEGSTAKRQSVFVRIKQAVMAVE